MLISGIRDEELERLHWRHGGGRATLGLRHIPSQIIVQRECLPNVASRRVLQELVVELRSKLQEAGLLSNEA